MTDISTLTVVQVGASLMDPQAIEIAKDFVAGFFGDYLFFQYSADDYVLIYDTDFSVDDESGFIMTGENFKVYEIGKQVVSSPAIYHDTFSANVIDIGTDTGIQSINGDIVRNEADIETVSWLQYSYTVDHQIAVDNVPAAGFGQYLQYASFGENPRLVDSAGYYGFLVAAIFSMAFITSLCFSIFKRVK